MRHLAIILAIAGAWALRTAAGAETLRWDFSPSPLERYTAGKAARKVAEKSPTAAASASGLTVSLERSYLRPGERWLEARVALAPGKTSLERIRLSAALFAPGGRQPLAEVNTTPQRSNGTLAMDLRGLEVSQARVVVEAQIDGRPAGVWESAVNIQHCLSPLRLGDKIPIQLDPPPGASMDDPCPVTFGVPFAAGSLWHVERLRVVDNRGRPLPHQKEVVATWAPDGAVKWVRFDALAVPAAGCTVEVVEPSAEPWSPPALRVARHESEVVVETGAARYVLSLDFSPIKTIQLGDHVVAASKGGQGMYVVDQQGRVGHPSAAGGTLEIESAGPLAACVRMEGFYRTAEGVPLARHITRLEFFAGRTAAQVTHTLVLCNDTNKLWLRDVGWELTVEPGQGPAAAFAVARTKPEQFAAIDLSAYPFASLLQDRHYCFAHGDDHFLISAATARGALQTVQEGRECGDWFLLAGRRAGLAFCCRDAARQYPKEYVVSRNRVLLRLFSPRGGEELDFRVPTLMRKWDLANYYPHVLDYRDRLRVSEFVEKVSQLTSNAIGWSKTHHILVLPLPGAETASSAAAAVARAARLHSTPVYALADPAWINASRALGVLHPRDPEHFPQAGGEEPYSKYSLPLYWESQTEMEISSATDLNQFLWFYYLTGDRRARDCVLAYAEGVKRTWTESKARASERILMLVRTLAQAYGVTWDATLRALAEATTDMASDADGDLGLTKERPYHATSYKTQVDVAALLDAWEILGDPRYRDLALKISQHWWNQDLGATPFGYCNPQGRIGDFLFEETGDPSIPAILAQQIRWAAAEFDVKSPPLKMRFGAATMTFLTQGIGYAEDLVLRTGNWPRPKVAWLGFEDFGDPVRVLLHKKDDERIDLRMAIPTLPGAEGEAGGAVQLWPIAPRSVWGLDLNRVSEASDACAVVRLPKDAPEGDYELIPERSGLHVVVAQSAMPLVLYAPQYWRPAPPADPPIKVYFQLPGDAREAAIFFEGSATVFDPRGVPLSDGAARHGWVELPGDRPGLWSFQPVVNKLVRVRNLPPLFAMGDPASYFPAKVAYPHESPPQWSPKIRSTAIFVPGAIQTPGNQAVYLPGHRSITLEAGSAHPGGDGSRFLPLRQGTIELWFKPDWSTFDHPPGEVTLMRLVAGKDSGDLTYDLTEAAEDFSHSDVLSGTLETDGASRHLSLRCHRRTVFEGQRWVHLAWCWGQRDDLGLGPAGQKLLTSQLFIDGKQGQCTFDKIPGNLPASPLKALNFGNVLDGAIDELRISDTYRYTTDFAPPARDRPLTCDRHTRALFHFDGTLEGETADGGPRPRMIMNP